MQQRGDPRYGSVRPARSSTASTASRSSGSTSSSAAVSVKTRTPYQVCSGAPIPARVDVSRVSPYEDVGGQNAASAPAQSPDSPARIAAASPLRTSSDSIPPGASIRATPASSASGSSTSSMSTP